MYAMPRLSIFIIAAIVAGLLAVAPLEMLWPWSGGQVPPQVPPATRATTSVPVSNAVVLDIDRSRKGDRLAVPHAADTDVTSPVESVEPADTSIVRDRFDRALFGVGPAPGSTIILKTIAVQKPIVLQTIPALVPPRVFDIERRRPSPARPITCGAHLTIIQTSDRLLGSCYA